MTNLRTNRLRFAALPRDASDGAKQQTSRQTDSTHLEAGPVDLKPANAVIEHIR